VQITGTHFLIGAVVFFGTVTAPTVTVDSTAQIHAITPAHVEGPVDVSVRNSDGQSAVLAQAFTYTTPSDPPSDPPPGNDSLLAGKTPANFTVPAGWTVAATQDFESGSLPAGQSMCSGAHVTGSSGHSGTHSATNTISYDSACANWIYNGGQLPGREFYLSYWDNGHGVLFNEEYTIFHVVKRNLGGDPGFEEFAGTLIYTDSGPGSGFLFNDPNATSINGPQGNYVTFSDYGGHVSNYGSTQWNQWEIWFRANTPNQNNGFFRVYLNGTLFYQVNNKALFGPVDMTGMQVEAAGWYTKSIWKVGSACAPSAGATGAVEVGACNDFHNCQCPPNPPTFNRYIDDVILMAK
jgi:hypothetical protein